MSDNQIDAYLEELPGLGKKQKYIYDVLRVLGPSTNQQLMDYLHMPANQVTARVCELQDMGWVIPDGELFNDKTKKFNTIYRALNEQLPEEKRRHKPTKTSGIYIYGRDANAILNFTDVITPDYTVTFDDKREAEVHWHRAGVILYHVNFITYNDHQLIFVSNGAKVMANIVR